MCCVVKTCAKYEIKKRDLFLFFFSLSSVFERFYYPKQKNSIERLFFGWSKVKKKNSRGGGKNPRPKTSTLSSLFTHTTHTSTIMFAATQQMRPSPARPPSPSTCASFVSLRSALAFENAVSLSLFFALVETPRVTFGGFWILRIFFEIRKKIASRAMCIAWRLTDQRPSIELAKNETRTSSSSRAIVLCADERTPSERDRSSGSTQPDRAREQRFWKKTSVVFRIFLRFSSFLFQNFFEIFIF